MFCENELHLLCDTLRKGHVRVSIGTPEELSSHLSDTGADGVLDSPLSGDDSTSRLLDASQPETVYRMVDASGLCFSFLRLCAPAQKKRKRRFPSLPLFYRLELAKLSLVDLDAGAHRRSDDAALDILTLCSSGLSLNYSL